MRATASAIAALVLGVAASAAAPPAATNAVDTPDAHISATMTAKDAGSAQWFFAMAPDDVLPLLPVNTRLDMLDYFNSGIERPSRDAAGSPAIVTSSSGRRLTFNTGDGSSYELAVYTAGRDTLVALVETLHYPMADSHIEWYDSHWQPLQPQLAEPGLSTWLTSAGRKHRAEVEQAIPFITAQAATDPDAGTITLTRTIDSYFLSDRAPAALRWLEPTLVYTLRGARFVRR